MNFFNFGGIQVSFDFQSLTNCHGEVMVMVMVRVMVRFEILMRFFKREFLLVPYDYLEKIGKS